MHAVYAKTLILVYQTVEEPALTNPTKPIRCEAEAVWEVSGRRMAKGRSVGR